MVRLTCPCGGSELTIVNTKDQKIRLTVPCYVCPRPHIYTVSRNLFFTPDVFAIPCQYSGMNVCFTGDGEKVQKAMEEEERQLTEMLGERRFSELSDRRGDGELRDPQIDETIAFVVKDLNEAGEIRCRCPAGEGEYRLEPGDEVTVVRCLRCGARAEIPSAHLADATRFLETCAELELK